MPETADMKTTREFLKKTAAGEEAVQVSRLNIPPHRPNFESSFYEYLILRGIRVDRFEPGCLSCSFRVPPRLTDSNGNLAVGAVASLVDLLGAAVVYENKDGQLSNVSVDLTVSYISSAKINDEVEVISRRLGKKNSYCGINVLIRNKTTGEVVAEGRHSMLSRNISKM